MSLAEGQEPVNPEEVPEGGNARTSRGPVRGVWFIALAAVLLHLLPHPGYGFHRDELLYLAMGDHLDLFRMSFPPMIAILAQTARTLPLETLTAVRLLPALAGAALSVLTALICRDLGGGRRAQVLAALAVLAAPLFLRAGTLFQPVVFEQLWWCLAVLGLTRRLVTGDRRWWLMAGAALGAGALTKFSVAFLGAGMLAAVAFSPLRQDLRTRWPWLALGLTALLALPSLTGQIAWDWPFLAQAESLRSRQLGTSAGSISSWGSSFSSGPVPRSGSSGWGPCSSLGGCAASGRWASWPRRYFC